LKRNKNEKVLFQATKEIKLRGRVLSTLAFSFLFGRIELVFAADNIKCSRFICCCYEFHFDFDLNMCVF